MIEKKYKDYCYLNLFNNFFKYIEKKEIIVYFHKTNINKKKKFNYYLNQIKNNNYYLYKKENNLEKKTVKLNILLTNNLYKIGFRFKNIKYDYFHNQPFYCRIINNNVIYPYEILETYDIDLMNEYFINQQEKIYIKNLPKYLNYNWFINLDYNSKYVYLKICKGWNKVFKYCDYKLF